MDNVKLLQKINNQKDELFKEINKNVIGQREVVENIFIALLCRGHILLEGVPGLGKTLIIKTIAKSLNLDFSRIQFTPDLMPSDIIGTEIISQDTATGSREFKFIKGPVFSNIILADEINRTPPKTQAALLEAMEETNVTIGGVSHSLDKPFFVLATQNPIEQEGTYPLPEAQLDRFMFNIIINYPSFNEEKDIVKMNTNIHDEKVESILSKEDIIAFQQLVLNVPVADDVIKYAVNFSSNTRPGSDINKLTQKYIEWGAGPRASSFLILAAKAKSVLKGSPTPSIDDVKAAINPVLRHRIILNFNAEAEGIKVDDILEELVKELDA